MARYSLIWSIAGMTVAMLGVPREKKQSSVLKDLNNLGISRFKMRQGSIKEIP